MPGSRCRLLLAWTMLVLGAGVRPAAAQPASDTTALAALRARVRAAERVSPAVADSAWSATVRAADVLIAREGQAPAMVPLMLRGFAALSLAEHRVAAARRDGSCTLARRAADAADVAQASFPTCTRVSTPALDSLMTRLNLVAPESWTLVRAHCR